MLVGYNLTWLQASRSNVTGVVANAMGHLFTDNAAIG
jgi:hypothetical protein